VAAIEPECVADAALKLVEGAALTQRRLEGLQSAADMIDQFAGASEIDGMLAAVFAEGEAIVGAEPLAVAVSPGGGDVALAGKELGTQGEEAQGWMNELVSRSWIFHFRGRPALV